MIKFGGKKLIISAIVTLVTTIFAACGLTIANVIQEYKEVNKSSMKIEAADWSGSGTESSPYLIYDIEDMNLLSSSVANGTSYLEKYFRLEADLDYSSVSNFNPIGTVIDSSKKMTKSGIFSGRFDGNGHTVMNMKTNVVDWSLSTTHSGLAPIGFFGQVGYDFTEYYSKNDLPNTYNYITKEIWIKNLKVKNFTINASAVPVYAGGICGSTTTNYDYYSHSTGQYDSNKKFAEVKYPVTISNCLVEGLSINIGEYGAASGLVGCQTTVGDNYDYTLKLQRLTIKHCMVLDVSITVGANSYASIITPGMGQLSLDGVHASAYYEFAYLYYISYCLTDNQDLYTIQGSSSDIIDYYDHDCNVRLLDSSDKARLHGSDRQYYLFEEDGDKGGLYTWDQNGSLKDWDGEKLYEVYNTVDWAAYSWAQDYNTYYDFVKHAQDSWSYDYDGWDDLNTNDVNETGKIWYCPDNGYDGEPSYKFMYLRTFLEETTVYTSDENKGTLNWLSVNDGECVENTENVNYTIVVPTSMIKSQDYAISGTNIKLWKLMDEYVYEFNAIVKSSSYKFNGWKGEGPFIAEFIDLGVNLIFKAAPGTNQTVDKTFTVTTGNTITVTKTTTLLQSTAYTTVKFQFKDASGKSQTHTYTLTDNQKYIEKHSLSSDSYKITGATTVTLTLKTRQHSSIFE